MEEISKSKQFRCSMETETTIKNQWKYKQDHRYCKMFDEISKEASNKSQIVQWDEIEKKFTSSWVMEELQDGFQNVVMMIMSLAGASNNKVPNVPTSWKSFRWS